MALRLVFVVAGRNIKVFQLACEDVGHLQDLADGSELLRLLPDLWEKVAKTSAASQEQKGYQKKSQEVDIKADNLEQQQQQYQRDREMTTWRVCAVSVGTGTILLAEE